MSRRISIPVPSLRMPSLAKMLRSTADFFQGGSVPSGDRDTRPPANKDTTELLSNTTWKNMLSSGRFLFANVPILRGAILEQAALSFPLGAHYVGRDKDWGKLAEDYIFHWQKFCNTKGPLYNAHTTARLRLIGRKVDGDIGTVWVAQPGDFPKIQLVRAHRVADRGTFNCEITEKEAPGWARGKRSCNGAIVDHADRTVGYRIVSRNARGGLGDPKEDQWVSANDMSLLYRPDYSDQFRGISEICACIRSFNDIAKLREYEMRAQKLGAAIALIEKNQSGAHEGDEMDGPVGNTERGLYHEEIQDGLIKYFKANSGGGLEAFINARPSADAQSWEDKIVTQAFYGIDWDANFAIALKEPGGAWARTVLQKINRSIANNVAIEKYAQENDIIFAIAKGIEAGLLPMPKDGDIFSWECMMSIPLITADSGNEEQAIREAYKLGLTTLQAIVSPKGKWWEEVREQQDVEIRDLLARAKTIQGEFPELTFQECIALYSQRTPNANSANGGADGDDGEEEMEEAA